MNESQFNALATILRLRPSPAQNATRLVMVKKMTVPDAAREAGLPYHQAFHAVKRVQKGLDIARKIFE